MAQNDQNDLYHRIVICSFFKILIFRFVSGAKGQKMAQDDKKFCHTPYLKNHTLYDCHLWYTSVMITSLDFYHFFQNVIFQEDQITKKAQNDKKLSHLISQEPCIIWSSCMVHMCKMIISSSAFYVKIVQNDQKFCLSCTISQEPYSYDCGFWYTYVKWWYLHQRVFIFSDFSGEKWPILTISVCHTLYLRNCRSYHQDFWYTGVK